jgi:hypothetical protein
MGASTVPYAPVLDMVGFHDLLSQHMLSTLRRQGADGLRIELKELGLSLGERSRVTNTLIDTLMTPPKSKRPTLDAAGDGGEMALLVPTSSLRG